MGGRDRQYDQFFMAPDQFLFNWSPDLLSLSDPGVDSAQTAEPESEDRGSQRSRNTITDLCGQPESQKRGSVQAETMSGDIFGGRDELVRLCPCLSVLPVVLLLEFIFTRCFVESRRLYVLAPSRASLCPLETGMSWWLWVRYPRLGPELSGKAFQGFWSRRSTVALQFFYLQS